MNRSTRIAGRGALLASLLVLGTPPDLHAQAPEDLPFDSGSTGADGNLIFPRGRYLHSGVYDPQGGAIVVAGGWTGSSITPGTWRWVDGRWDSPSGDASFPVYGSPIVYDATDGRQELVNFGGYDGTAHLPETRVWDRDNSVWVTRDSAVSPPGRRYHVMAYDSEDDRSLLFGGIAADEPFGDMWSWNGTTWTQLEPPQLPSARYYAAAAYDSGRGKLVLFGGSNGTRGLSDTWEWDSATDTWTDVTPASGSPIVRWGAAMAYDPGRGEIVLFGGRSNSPAYLNDTWVWNGTSWTERIANGTAGSPIQRAWMPLTYHEGRQRMMMMGGTDIGGRRQGDLWEWDGISWTEVQSYTSLVVDMNDKPDGVYHYNRISIPTGMALGFQKNAANTPVVWLAKEDVEIGGTVIVDGQNAGTNNATGNQARGGPGGFDGGLGGQPFQTSGTYAGTPGQGPGGGAPGTTSAAQGHKGTFRGVYGNGYLIPLIGGSGGGGGASNNTTDGGNGGGGGGAILIASSRTITVGGIISADGGDGRSVSGATGRGAGGSGGAIRLVADEVRGGGTVRANAGNNGIDPGNTDFGRIRVEGFLRPFLESGTDSPGASLSVPLDLPLLSVSNPTLSITQVAGNPVAQPPTGSMTSPDVVFSEAGEVTIRVEGTGVPDGTPVTGRITIGAQIISLPADGEPDVLMTGGVATLAATVEPGVGTIQAFVTFTQPTP